MRKINIWAVETKASHWHPDKRRGQILLVIAGSKDICQRRWNFILSKPGEWKYSFWVIMRSLSSYSQTRIIRLSTFCRPADVRLEIENLRHQLPHAIVEDWT